MVSGGEDEGGEVGRASSGVPSCPTVGSPWVRGRVGRDGWKESHYWAKNHGRYVGKSYCFSNK